MNKEELQSMKSKKERRDYMVSFMSYPCLSFFLIIIIIISLGDILDRLKGSHSLNKETTLRKKN